MLREFVHSGFLAGDHDVDVSKIEAFAALGATWWLEQIYASRMTPAKLSAFIRRGPPPQN